MRRCVGTEMPASAESFSKVAAHAQRMSIRMSMHTFKHMSIHTSEHRSEVSFVVVGLADGERSPVVGHGSSLGCCTRCAIFNVDDSYVMTANAVR